MKHFTAIIWITILNGICGHLFAQDKAGETSLVSASEATPKEHIVTPTVILSEMTLDHTLGSQGSWMELWNPAGQAIDIGDSFILVDGKEVRPFPMGLVLKAKGFVVVRFEKHEAVGVDGLMKSLKLTNSATVWHDPVMKQKDMRTPGFCALYAPAKASVPQRMLDYVRWGDKNDFSVKPDAFWREAQKSGLWGMDVVHLGLSQSPGDAGVLQKEGVLSRLMCQTNAGRLSSWCIADENFSSPGFGNRFPPPSISGLIGESSGARRLIVRVYFMEGVGRLAYRLMNSGMPEKPYRLQIASDPHFQTIIQDLRIPASYESIINAALPRICFLRVCLDGCGMSTDWSREIRLEIGSAEKSAVLPQAMFSKMTVGKSPGSDGSWIEIWNPADNAVDLSGYVLVIDGQEVDAFPPKLELAAKGFVLVRFGMQKPGSSKIVKNMDCTTIWHDPIVKQSTRKLNGFCALYVSGKGMLSRKHIQDYVRWGKRAPGKDKHLTSAIKAGLWGQEDIELPLPAMENPWPHCAPVLSRQKFNPGSGNRDCWMVLEARQAQRGFGNLLLLPPAVIRPGLCAEVSARANLTIDFEPPPGLQARIPNPQDEKTLIRLQIATDPHFSDVVLDQSAGLHGELAKGTLKPGIYFIRSRIDCRSQVSDWSKGQVFYLHE